MTAVHGGPADAAQGDGVTVSGSGQDRPDATSPPPRRRLAIPWWIPSIIGGLAIWEMAVRGFGVSELLLVPPSAIFDEFMKMLGDGMFWSHVAISTKSFLLGYGSAALAGIVLGLLLGASRVARGLFEPWIIALYATPSVALAPLFIVALGFGVTSKAAVVALSAFFPVIINTLAGALAVDKDLREVAIAYRATGRETFRFILLPGSLPYILTGLRLAVGRALIGVVVADLFGASEGLGFMLFNAAAAFNTAGIFVVVVILAAAGIAMSGLVGITERHFASWKIS
ncbi:MAG: ABC transporter permease [Micromonosporaceae bacterium]